MVEKLRGCPAVEFGVPTPVEAVDPVTGESWACIEQKAQFPKLGGHFREAYLVHNALEPQEIDGILEAAKAMDMKDDNDGSPLRTGSVDVMHSGHYQCPSLVHILRPIVDMRLLPYVRHRYDCPGAVVCSASIKGRRLAWDGGLDIPPRCRVDDMYFCSVTVPLNPQDVEEGGICVQSAASVDSQALVRVDAGGMLVHQYDLPRGVRIRGGTWYSLELHFKDSILACLTNTALWYDALAEEGDADAQANLASHCERGLDVTARLFFPLLLTPYTQERSAVPLGSWQLRLWK